MRSSNLATASLGVNDAESMVVSTVWLDIFSVRLDPRVDERSLVDSFNWGGDYLAGGRTSIRKRAPLSISLRQGDSYLGPGAAAHSSSGAREGVFGDCLSERTLPRQRRTYFTLLEWGM